MLIYTSRDLISGKVFIIETVNLKLYLKIAETKMCNNIPAGIAFLTKFAVFIMNVWNVSIWITMSLSFTLKKTLYYFVAVWITKLIMI